MFFAKSHIELNNIRNSVERIKRVSDGLVKIGPFGFGLDAIASVVPALGAAYSGMAGVMLLYEAVRARAAPMVMVEMAMILILDTLAPYLGKGFGTIVDSLFTGHKWAADMLTKHMDETIYFEGDRNLVMGSSEYRDLMARIRAGKEKRRVVFLGL